MKPNRYKEYSDIIDFFSDTRMSPSMNDFLWDLINILKKLNKNELLVSDIGAGTGYYAYLYYSLATNIILTAVEPSVEMMNKLKKRFKDSPDVIYSTLLGEEYIQKCTPQDVFIFQRSLYSFFNNYESYEQLIQNLHKKTNNYGIIAVLDKPEPTELKLLYQYALKTAINRGFNKDIFIKKWKILENSTNKTNEKFKNREYTLFPPHKLNQLFNQNGFHTLLNTHYYSFFIKKP